jgi:hypothetical protein
MRPLKPSVKSDRHLAPTDEISPPSAEHVEAIVRLLSSRYRLAAALQQTASAGTFPPASPQPTRPACPDLLRSLDLINSDFSSRYAEPMRDFIGVLLQQGRVLLDADSDGGEETIRRLRELIARIAVDSPEWTDFNESDPGVTLVELFAFLADTLLWHIDERQRNRRRRRRRRRAVLVVGSAGVGLVLWSWFREHPLSTSRGAV